MKSLDGRLVIYRHDLFTLDPALLSGIDCVFDRGSLVAILPEERELYAKTMEKFLGGNERFRYLLLTYEYDTNVFPGPPRAVPCEQIRRIFGKTKEYFISSKDSILYHISFLPDFRGFRPHRAVGRN